GRREHARPDAGVALPEAAFRLRVRELRRAAVARRRDRRAPRGAHERTGEGEEESAERRAFVELLALQIVEQMNLAVVPHATSVAACALLGERRRGLFRADLALRMQQLVDLLRIMNVKLTPA